jgi:hypothetical protein
MKNRLLVLLVLLVTLSLYPTGSYAASTSSGNPWDILVDQSPFTGTKLDATLSILFAPIQDPTLIDQPTKTVCDKIPAAVWYAYVTVRFSKGFQLYAYQTTLQVCKGSYWEIKDKLMPFLDQSIEAVLPKTQYWAIKSVTNPAYDDISRTFVADLQIAVQTK